MYADVAIPPLARPYTYQVPPALTGTITVGHKVSVQLGRQFTAGFVIALRQAAPEGLGDKFEAKPLLEILGGTRSFPEDELPFFKWVADYYAVPLANVIDTAVPPLAPVRYVNFIGLAAGAAEPRGKLQRALLEELRKIETPLSQELLSKKYRGAAAAIKKLAAAGLVTIERREARDRHLSSEAAPAWAKTEVSLNSAQQRALKIIVDGSRESRFQPIVLFGVTGSGKTEVYIEAIREVLGDGKTALVVVPEIALTPQLIDRFRARFGNEIAVLHSALNRRERWDSWRAIAEGRNRIVIGARSAVFAPLSNIGVIIVDEEHDPSFKQSEGLRYNGRDLAVTRGKLARCPVVLGSATPSLESYYNAASKKYLSLGLPQRFGLEQALRCELVDLGRIKPRDMKSPNVSAPLHDAIAAALEQGEQCFILYNRRGFASYLQCDKCGQALHCPNCSVTLTYHRGSHSLVCHYCNLQQVPPAFCRSCRDQPREKGLVDVGHQNEAGKLVQRGSGTEKIHEELGELFPQARIDRLDRDVAQSTVRYREIIAGVRSGTTNILVGTQMIAKGHDLPGVTVVGVIDCDVGLHLPDFRAGERVFQLLTQAAGRAGRGERPGRVLLQTRVPKHPSLVCTLQQDYSSFARLELASRKALRYPPFTRLLRIVAASRDAQQPARILKKLRDLAAHLSEQEQLGVQLLGPAPAPLEKLKTHWRWHLLLKAGSAKSLHRLLTALQQQAPKSNAIKVIFDLDPQDMM